MLYMQGRILDLQKGGPKLRISFGVHNIHLLIINEVISLPLMHVHQARRALIK